MKQIFLLSLIIAFTSVTYANVSQADLEQIQSRVNNMDANQLKERKQDLLDQKKYSRQH